MVKEAPLFTGWGKQAANRGGGKPNWTTLKGGLVKKGKTTREEGQDKFDDPLGGGRFF